MFRRHFLLTAVGLLTVRLAATADDPARDDAKRFLGRWQIVDGEDDGRRETPERIKDTFVDVTPDQISVTDRDQKKTWVTTYKLDPSQSPRTIAMTVTQGEWKGKTAHGIYRFDGDTLRICYALPGQPAPAEFTTKPGSKQLVFVLKRAAAK
jgi:uncharacterized protein (TIGR03067 family)